MKPSSVGSAVAAARECAGITLRELGARLGVSHAHVCDLEHGRRAASPARWPRLVAALEGLVTLEDLAGAAVAGDGRVTIELGELSPEQRAAVAAILLEHARRVGGQAVTVERLAG